MISLEELQKWQGFPWADFQKWLEENQIAYEVVKWEPDTRSQFEVDLNRCYVMQVRLEAEKVWIDIAGKMLGRK